MSRRQGIFVSNPYYSVRYTPQMSAQQEQNPLQGNRPPYGPRQDPYGMFESQNDNAGAVPSVAAASDPPILSNNPVTPTLSLFKELTGYPNYGNPSRNADILYTGNRGTWTFDAPAFLAPARNPRVQVILRAVLDDHSAVSTSRYSAKIAVNGIVVHTGRLPLDHGVPAGTMFTNWRELRFNVGNFRRTNSVTVENTSTAGPEDWIAFDWMDMRLARR